MLSDIKALIVVLVIATAVFMVAKPLCARFVDPLAFVRRRNVWFALTIVGFLSPSIWMYALIAMPVMYLAAKRDDNPLALYVMLMFVIPNTSVPIPTIGIGQLFEANHMRMMSAVILWPAVLRRRRQQPGLSKFTLIDWLLVAYCALQLALVVPYESPTNTLRRGLLLFLDTFIVFYAFSRVPRTRRSVGEMVVMFCVVCGILAPIAIFESLRSWLLYQSLSYKWGVPNVFSWLQRGDSLRAQVSTGHSLVLGYTISLGLGCWMYMRSQVERSLLGAGITLVLCLGLFVSYSRGAWLMAVVLLVAYLALRPGAAGFFVKVLPVLLLLGVVAYLSPLKELLIDRLPIIGTADQDTIDYRRRLAEVSWRLIKLNPVFGDPFVTNNMEEMRQGQGIIDIINGYIAVTLYSGFVGLTLFVSFFLVALWRCFVAVRAWTTGDPDAAALGGALCAGMIASLFFIATAGVGSVEYLLAGMMMAFVASTAPKASKSTNRRPAGVSIGRGIAS